jgi:hypothetical protein
VGSEHSHAEPLLRARRKIARANITTDNPSKNPIAKLPDDPRILKSSITEDMLEVMRPITRRIKPLVNFLSVMRGLYCGHFIKILHLWLISLYLLYYNLKKRFLRTSWNQTHTKRENSLLGTETLICFVCR